MMMLLAKSVECSQKIAMTTLRHGPATIGLLPNHRLPRRVFSDAGVAQHYQSQNGQRNSICMKLRSKRHRSEQRCATSDDRTKDCAAYGIFFAKVGLSWQEWLATRTLGANN
jgi:hypothetical protein